MATTPARTSKRTLRSDVVTVELVPVVASRARGSGKFFYYEKKYVNFMREAEAQIKLRTRPLTGALSVKLWTICPRPKTVKDCQPMGDFDNYEKAITDLLGAPKPRKNKPGLMTGHRNVWLDDRQICEITHIKRYVRPGETPKFHLEVSELPHSPDYYA